MQYYTYVNMHLLYLEWHFFIPFKETVIFFYFLRRSITEGQSLKADIYSRVL